MISVQINGKKESLESDATIGSVLKNRQVNPNTVACELNLKIIKRAHLNDQKLKEGDVLEIISMIGGG